MGYIRMMVLHLGLDVLRKRIIVGSHPNAGPVTTYTALRKDLPTVTVGDDVIIHSADPSHQLELECVAMTDTQLKFERRDNLNSTSFT